MSQTHPDAYFEAVPGRSAASAGPGPADPSGPPDAVDPLAPQRFRSLPACVGPWSADAMHGGPPSALLVRACERAASGVAPGLVALRVAVDFLSPVPTGEVEVTAHVVRPGRRITLTEATLRAGGRVVLAARTWHVAAPGVDLPLPADPPVATVPPPEAGTPLGHDWSFPYARSVDWRVVGGDVVGPGDATVWARPRTPLLAGEPAGALQRVVLVADSGNGLSARLDWGVWSYVNVDLTVHLSRPPAGDWLLLEATSRYSPGGTGLATTVVHDASGVVGAGAQTLVVSPR